MSSQPQMPRFLRPEPQVPRFMLSVAPQSGEPVILKTEINGFQGTDLKQQLDQQGIQNLVICGAMSHICIDALDASCQRFWLQMHRCPRCLRDAGGRSLTGYKVPAESVHAAFMAALQFGYAEVVNAAEVLTA